MKNFKGKILVLFFAASTLGTFAYCMDTEGDIGVSAAQSDNSLKRKRGGSDDGAQPQKKARTEEIEAPVCSICLASFTDVDDIMTTSCQHTFHVDCIREWITHQRQNSTCPLCRNQKSMGLEARILGLDVHERPVGDDFVDTPPLLGAIQGGATAAEIQELIDETLAHSTQEQFEQFIMAQDEEDFTALVQAAGDEKSEIVQVILTAAVTHLNPDQFAQFINTRNIEGETALNFAASSDDTDSILALLDAAEQRLNPHQFALFINARNEDGGLTALIWAARNNNHEVLMAIIAAAREHLSHEGFVYFINERGEDNKSALNFVIENDDQDAEAALIQAARAELTPEELGLFDTAEAFLN